MFATKTAIVVAGTNAAWTLATFVPASVAAWIAGSPVAAALTAPDISVPALFWGASAGLCRGMATGLDFRKTGMAIVVGGVTAAGLYGAHIPGLDGLIANLSEANHDFIKGGFAVLFWGIGEDYLRAKWGKK